MTKAFNLANDTEVLFDKNTLPIYAVAYGYCSENNLMSALFNSCHSNTLLEFYKKLPIIEGARMVTCGDWAARNIAGVSPILTVKLGN